MKIRLEVRYNHKNTPYYYIETFDTESNTWRFTDGSSSLTDAEERYDATIKVHKIGITPSKVLKETEI